MTDPANRFSEIGRNHNHAEPVKIWKARKFVDENYSEKISLTRVAHTLNMNPTHLSEKFKEVNGINFCLLYTSDAADE